MLSKILVLGFAVSLMGAGAWAGTPTPEATVLENIVTLEGQSLSTAQKQAQFNQTLKTYFATAPQQGQQARFQQALVDLHLLTPAQASAFVSNARASATRISTSTVTGEAQTEMISDEITQLAQTSLAGAQFSGRECAKDIFFGLGIGAASGYIAYLLSKYGDDAEYPARGGLIIGISVAAFMELVVLSEYC